MSLAAMEDMVMAAMEERRMETEEVVELIQAQVAAYAERCTAKVKSWEGGAQMSLPYRSGTVLGLDIWEIILKKLCEDLDTEGLRGPSVIARDLIDASLTCKEVHAATLPALQHLAQMCPSISATVSDELWNEFVVNPSKLNLSDIKNLAKSGGVSLGQRKSIITVQIMERMGLTRPIRVPARVLKAVVREKCERPEGVLQMCHRIPGLTGGGHTMFSVRLKCQQMGFINNLQLQEAADAEQKAREDQQKAEKAAKKAERAERDKAKAKRRRQE